MRQERKHLLTDGGWRRVREEQKSDEEKVGGKKARQQRLKRGLFNFKFLGALLHCEGSGHFPLHLESFTSSLEAVSANSALNRVPKYRGGNPVRRFSLATGYTFKHFVFFSFLCPNHPPCLNLLKSGKEVAMKSTEWEGKHVYRSRPQFPVLLKHNPET